MAHSWSTEELLKFGLNFEKVKSTNSQSNKTALKFFYFERN